MNVLQICPNYAPLFSTSGGLAVSRHAMALQALGVSSALALIPPLIGLPNLRSTTALPPPECERLANLATYWFADSADFDRQILGLIAQFRPSILHFHHYHHLDCAHDLAAFLGIGLVYTGHLPIGDPQWSAREQRLRPALDPAAPDDWACIRHADRVIVFLESGRERIIRVDPHAADKLRIVAHGVADRPEIREFAFNRSPRAKTNAVYIGRFVQEKGIDDLMAAIPLALAQLDHLHFTLVGLRHDDGSADEWLVRLPIGCRHRVRVVCWCPPNEIEAILRDADLLVAPSHFESFGMAITEAMLFGVPVVATASEGAQGLVGAAQCGVLVDQRDEKALAAAIVELARDQSGRMTLGKRGAAYVREHLSWEQIGREMIQVYRETMEGLSKKVQ